MLDLYAVTFIKHYHNLDLYRYLFLAHVDYNFTGIREEFFINHLRGLLPIISLSKVEECWNNYVNECYQI